MRSAARNQGQGSSRKVGDMSHQDKKERVGGYWICTSCANERGWILKDKMNTLIMGLCGHCDSGKEEMLTPTIDFIKPKGNK